MSINTRFKFFGAVAIASLSLGISGCGKNGDGSHKKPVLGGFTSYATNLEARAKKNGWQGACTISDDEIRTSITSQIDAKAGVIKNFIVQNRLKLREGSFRVGPLVIRPAAPVAPSDKWVSDPISWKYLKSEIDDPHPLTPQGWTKMSRIASRLLDEDWTRMADEYTRVINYDNIHLFRQAYEISKACVEAKNCTAEMFGGEIANVFRLDWYYLAKLEYFKTATPEEMNTSVRIMRDDLKRDLWSREFRFNAGIVRLSQTELEVAMDAGNLAGNERELGRLLEEKWKSPALSVKIRWTSQAREKNAFKIEFVGDKQFDSFVNTDKKYVRLSAIVSRYTLTHEFGHVLGFRDQYYTVWDNLKCQYDFWYNNADLMSDNAGRVTAAEWEKLDETYPLVPRRQTAPPGFDVINNP